VRDTSTASLSNDKTANAWFRARPHTRTCALLSPHVQYLYVCPCTTCCRVHLAGQSAGVGAGTSAVGTKTCTRKGQPMATLPVRRRPLGTVVPAAPAGAPGTSEAGRSRPSATPWPAPAGPPSSVGEPARPDGAAAVVGVLSEDIRICAALHFQHSRKWLVVDFVSRGLVSFVPFYPAPSPC
jgi:hypothetical protein